VIPLGVADARVAGWPVVTFAVAGASALLTAAVWMAPDAAVQRAQADVRRYATDHPEQAPPEGCVPQVLDATPRSKEPVVPATAEFERRCNRASEAMHSGHQLRFALQPPGRPTPGLAWVLHPFAWANPLAAIAGLTLLVLVVGTFVEDRYGRAPFAAILALSAAVAALAWRWAAGEASAGWSGGQGCLAALLAVFVVTFVARPVKFLVFTPLPRMVEWPAWAVAAWWLVARVVSLWLGDMDRPLVVAELVSFLAGGAAAVALRVRFPGGALPTRVDPRAGSGHTPRLPEPAQGAPPPARASHIAAPAAADDLPPAAHGAAAPDAAWAVAGVDPLAEPEITVRKRSAVEDPPSVAAVAAPPARGTGDQAPTSPLPAPSAAAHEPDLAGMVFDFSEPAGVEFAGQGSGFSSPLSAAVAPSQAPPALAELELLRPPPEVDLEALLAGLPPPPAADHDTDIIAPPSVALEPALPPPLAAATLGGYDETTVAYGPGRSVAHPVPALQAEDPRTPRVRLAARVDRLEDGALRALVDGQWVPLDQNQVRAVAVGLVLHRDHPGAAPEIWIDVITDLGGRDRPACAIRLHPARDDLARLLPEVAPSHAFARLAELLAAGGAFQLPQQPVWPGPPFPRYDTAAEFIRMWHRQLHG